jgi:transcription termination/antitermination protein NusG
MKRSRGIFIRQWSDRKKKMEVPLFNSYLFVLTTEDKIADILQTPGVSWNIRYNDKPAVLRQEEMNIIERFLLSGLFIETRHSEQLSEGDPVKVIDGPLKGLTGRVLRSSSGDKFLVLLASIQQNITVAIDTMVLKLLK